jgi:drug/metabolite transporter (DMT)-like permease
VIRNNTPLTLAQLIGGMATFGSATPVSKIVTQAMPVFVGSALRVGIGALALAPLAWGKLGTIRDMTRGDWARIAVIAIFGMFGFSALMLYGMSMVSGVAGAIVMSTAPAVTAAASMLFLGDHPTWRKLTAIALAVCGVLVLNLGGGSGGESGGNLLLGTVMVFAAVCCESVYTLVGKTASERVDPVLVAFLAAVLALPAFLPFAIWQWLSFDPSQVEPGAWMALVWYAGVKKAEGAVAAAFMGVMPASALILSYVLLGEPFRFVHLAGFAIVFAGVLVMSWEHTRMSQKADDQ